MFDIFIIGGGINGSGIARDAAGRGYKVGLAEQFDFGSQTSSWSTKLIHGGIRYLENYEFSLVQESLKEREVINKIARNISNPMEFILPHVPSLRSSWIIQTGLFLYDFLAGKSKFSKSKKLNFKGESLEFLSQKYEYGYQYSDLQIDDSRLTLLNILDAQKNGAVVKNYTKVLSARKTKDGWEISLSNGQKYLTKFLINASGPMISKTFESVLPLKSLYPIRLIQGSHIIVKKLYEENKSYILQQPDKRIVFIIPYLDKYSLIGTTELEVESATKPQITNEEKEYLIECVNRFAKDKLSIKDILWNYSGVRPLIVDNSKSISRNSRDYHLDVQLKSSHLINIFGGKLTTYRKLSEKTVDEIDKYLRNKIKHWTHLKSLPGCENEPQITNTFGLDQNIITRITRTYGDLTQKVLNCMENYDGPGDNICGNLYEFEIYYLVKNEFAKNSDDILFRRSKLGIEFNKNEIRTKIDEIIKKLHN